MNRIAVMLSVALLLLAGIVQAKVDLVTLPTRDSVQLTIYNSADLTLVREVRLLTLKKGLNKMQFSWANTLIDPTSLEMVPKADADKIQVFDLTYPPRVQNLGVWNIRSEVSGKVPVEITYLTSGLSWRAFYMGTLAADEKTMFLQGYVRVTNGSGEEYEDAQTRLIVGKVHILDQIAELARRQPPYGRPGVMGLGDLLDRNGRANAPEDADRGTKFKAGARVLGKDLDELRAKEIRKEGLSEYFLYTIAGTETIADKWSKRLPSFEATNVPVVNLYKFEEERYGQAVVRFLSFKNDEKHNLGKTPIPGGMLRVYRGVDAERHLSYEGQSEFKYIPIEQKVELNLGAVGNVVVEPKLMNYRTDQYTFDGHGDVNGWDEIREWKLEVKNTRDLTVKVEIQRKFPTQYWDLEKSGEHGEYEKVDLNTVKFTLALEPRSKKEFKYVLTTRHGRRAEEKK